MRMRSAFFWCYTRLCFSTLAITSTEDFEEELTIDEDLQGHDFISLKLQMHNMNTF